MLDNDETEDAVEAFLRAVQKTMGRSVDFQAVLADETMPPEGLGTICDAMLNASAICGDTMMLASEMIGALVRDAQVRLMEAHLEVRRELLVAAELLEQMETVASDLTDLLGMHGLVNREGERNA
jgi:hypothetical protein